LLADPHRLHWTCVMDSSPPRPGALAEALLHYRGMLFGFIYSLVRDVLVAEEIFQEVAVIALEKDRKGDELIREPAQWLKEVVRRLVQAGFRTRQGRVVQVEPDYLEQVAQAKEIDELTDPQQTQLAALGNCLEHVSPQNRDLLQRRYVQGASYEEIARHMQRTPGALRVLIHRIQRHLADCVEHRLGGKSEI
jgi:RNA polymerase sigma-70 factor (ECF subfamily)